MKHFAHDFKEIPADLDSLSAGPPHEDAALPVERLRGLRVAVHHVTELHLEGR